jgi:NADH-quinone oxidoreductase subunit J
MAVVAFAILAGLAVACALGLVIRRNPIHAALFLVGNLASLAGLYLLMRAEFLALIQVVVYAGAIAVLFVFAIQVLIPGKEETGPDPLLPQRWLALPLGGLLLLEVTLILRSGIFGGSPAPPGTGPSLGLEALYRLLLTDFLLPFEVTSLLLLAAIVGVMALTKGRPSGRP